jgi:hypothetical protein
MTDFKLIEGDITLRKSNGTELGTGTDPLRVDPTGTTAQPVSDGGGSLTVDATSLPLPTGAATETTLAAINTATGTTADADTVNTVIGRLKQIITRLSGGLPAALTGSGNLKTAISEALPAGTNNIGDVDVVSSALPTGAATETTLASINTKTLAAGQALMTASSPVVIASDQLAVASKNAAASQVDGHSATIGTTTDADTTNTVIGRLKQLVTKLAGGLPAALVGGRLDSNIGAWLGSTAPTVGQKTQAASIPVVLPSDQTVAVSSGATEEQTFTVVALNATIGSNKSMLSIYNPTGSSKVLKLREYYVRNSQTSAVTGVIGEFRLLRVTGVTGVTGGTALTPERHDTTNTLGAGILCHTGATAFTGGTESTNPLDIMRISTDEWGTGTLDQEGAQQTIANYLPARVKRDAQQQPFVLRGNEAIHLKFATASTAGAFDIIFIFTQV